MTSATDEVRRLLNERCVEWDKGAFPNEARTYWRGVVARPWDEQRLYVTALLTPEQAIEATLGRDDSYTREDVEGAFVSGYSLGLDMFDLSKPDAEKGWNQNERELDEEMEERGWVRKEATTHMPLTERAAKDSEKDSDGYGECRAEEADTWECVCDQIGRYGKRVTIHVMECSACGQTFEHVNGGYEHCPRCGAAIREG